MTLPKQIKFGTYVAKIIYEKQSRDHDYYATDISKQALMVYTEYPFETVRYALFEGIIFLLDGYLTMVAGDKTFCLDQFARLLYSVLKSNPDLVSKKIPEQVTIIGKIFQVCYQVQLSKPYLSGEMDFSLCKILLENDMAKRQMFAVFWHEVIHEIVRIIDRSFNKEDFVHQLAILVSELIYGNDLSWIFEGEKSDIPKVD